MRPVKKSKQAPPRRAAGASRAKSPPAKPAAASGKKRWFLSYHSPDQALAERLKAAIEHKDAATSVFFAPKHLRAGGSWSAQLAEEIAEANGFILLIGEAGIGKWQVPEYYEAHDRWVSAPTEFPLVVVLLEGQTAPGLPFLRQLHWIITPDPASEKDVARLFDAAAGGGSSPGQLWRYTSPYRGLAAMEEKDSDYFFGRKRETVDVLSALAGAPDRVPVLIGNSGVGKSSLAQAGVLAALKRQAWPADEAAPKDWPHAFADSRRWCFLTVRPGTEPVRALVEAFLDTWQLDRLSTEWPTRRAEWVDALLNRKLTLRDLLDQTGRRYAELQRSQPPTFFLYIDQGEELYARAVEQERRCFSEILAGGLRELRLRGMMSMRADFFGELQNDEPLQDASRKIEVPPLREAQLREVVSRPPELLSARFETKHLPGDIARRAAEESVNDAGALPLLSYLLEDMWQNMVARGDGELRLPAHSIDLGLVLVQRADAFVARNPNAEKTLRGIFTVKLATVREDGEPTRRRAYRSEFSDEEWRLVSELADHPSRLLVTATPEVGETYAEVAHEAIFRRWDKLREWIDGEREFLIWRPGLERDRGRWQAMPERLKNDALLTGAGLDQAQSWLAMRAVDLPPRDREFIGLSIERENNVQAHARNVLGAWLDDGTLSHLSEGVCMPHIWEQRYDPTCPSEFYRGYATLLFRISDDAFHSNANLAALLIDALDFVIKALPRFIPATDRAKALMEKAGVPIVADERTYGASFALMNFASYAERGTAPEISATLRAELTCVARCFVHNQVAGL
jgi:hypothetical protein